MRVPAPTRTELPGGIVHKIPDQLEYRAAELGASKLRVEASVIFQGDHGIQSQYVKTKPGDTGGFHKHGWTQVMVVSGAVEVGVEGADPMVVRAGELYFIDAGVPHYETALEEGVVIVTGQVAPA